MGGKPLGRQAQEAQGMAAGWGKTDKGPETNPKGAPAKGWFCLLESTTAWRQNLNLAGPLIPPLCHHPPPFQEEERGYLGTKSVFMSMFLFLLLTAWLHFKGW